MRRFLFAIFLCFTIELATGYDLSRVNDLLSKENIKEAKQALAEQYIHVSNKQEKEELELLAARLFIREKNYSQAAAIYRRILIDNPSLIQVRLELGYVYFLMKEDDKARYNLRLVLAEKELPPQVRNDIFNLLDVIRRRKSWGIYVSVGITPDTNVNTVSGRRLSCLNFMGIPICRELDNAETDIGFQGLASLEYIYKFTDSWGLKSRLTVDAIDYQDKQYSFWGIGSSLGPRYVTDFAEYSIGVGYRQQWNDEHRYNYAPGAYAEMSTDLSRKLSFYDRFSYNKINYNIREYQVFNSHNYANYARLVYSLNNYSYMTLSAGVSYEDSRYKWNSYWRQNYGVGYGRELPWGFIIYVEPNFSVSQYRDRRYFVNGKGGVEQWKRKDVMCGIYLSLSSKLLRVYNITPTLNYIYNKRTSNVFNYEYERSRLELGISRSF